jgi:hypothetical protein
MPLKAKDKRPELVNFARLTDAVPCAKCLSVQLPDQGA